jgi:hypothetical protein
VGLSQEVSFQTTLWDQWGGVLYYCKAGAGFKSLVFDLGRLVTYFVLQLWCSGFIWKFSKGIEFILRSLRGPSMATLRFGLLPSEPLKINSNPFDNFKEKPLRNMNCD